MPLKCREQSGGVCQKPQNVLIDLRKWIEDKTTGRERYIKRMTAAASYPARAPRYAHPTRDLDRWAISERASPIPPSLRTNPRGHGRQRPVHPLGRMDVDRAERA